MIGGFHNGLALSGRGVGTIAAHPPGLLPQLAIAPVAVAAETADDFRRRNLPLDADRGRGSLRGLSFGRGVNTSTTGRMNPAYAIAPNRIPGHSLTGLSTDPGMQSIILSAPAIAGSVLTIGGTSSSIAAGLWGAAAIPVIGAIVAGVTLGLTALFARKGPKQRLATTAIVNELEPKLRDNVTGYFAIRTKSAQAQALANFDAAWQWLIEHCAIEQYGDPGQHCVSDRDRNACLWRRGEGDPWQQYDGVLPGECWNWFKGYRDPIANDTPIPDPALTGPEQAAIANVLGTLDQAITGGSPAGAGNYLLLGGGLLILAAVLGGFGS